MLLIRTRAFIIGLRACHRDNLIKFISLWQKRTHRVIAHRLWGHRYPVIKRPDIFPIKALIYLILDLPIVFKFQHLQNGGIQFRLIFQRAYKLLFFGVGVGLFVYEWLVKNLFLAYGYAWTHYFFDVEFRNLPFDLHRLHLRRFNTLLRRYYNRLLSSMGTNHLFGIPFDDKCIFCTILYLL